MLTVVEFELVMDTPDPGGDDDGCMLQAEQLAAVREHLRA
jgi:hypothetical protein